MPFTSFLSPAVFALSGESGAASSGTVGADTLMEVITSITGQISPTTILAVIVAAIGAAVGFVFLWWGVRKLLSTFFSGFRKGKASV